MQIPKNSKKSSLSNSLQERNGSSILQSQKPTKLYSAYSVPNTFDTQKAGPISYKSNPGADSPNGFSEYTMDFSLDFTS
jgi:hypothetical protein